MGETLAQGSFPLESLAGLVDPAKVAESRSIGTFLPAPVRQALAEEMARGRARLALAAHGPGFEGVPWEALWLDGPGSGFLGLRLSLARHGGAALPDVPATEPLKALVAWADPARPEFLSLERVEAEADGLTQRLSAAGLAVRVLPQARRGDLERVLAGERFDLFHFAGHCDASPTGASLVLQDGERLHADDLGGRLRRAGVRLAVLAACGLPTECGAAALVRAGIGAAVGAGRPVRDRAAAHFTHSFYAGLLQGRDVGEAVRDARNSLADAGEDWTAFVLVARAGAAGRPLFAPSPPKDRLPQEDRPLLGRARERAALAGLVRQEDARQVTVTALGGMGKTRLALAVAHDAAPAFPGGALWVDCSDLESSEDLVAAIAAATPGDLHRPDEAQLAASLGGARTLLVLDCFERMVPHAATVQRLLDRAPGLVALVTSRRLLGLPFEREFPVGPLLERGRERTRAGMELFERAASQAKHDFRLARKDRKTVREIVEAVEAVPLAIVLAAGRLRTLSVDDLLDQVRRRRLEVLRRRAVGNDRHATMLRVVGDSFELLEPDELSLMLDLSVFQGGFGPGDAESVLLERKGLQDGIDALCENSLLNATSVEGRTRYRTLDTIREYMERLTGPNDRLPIRQAHAIHYANRAEELRRRADQGEWKAANAGLWLEVANVRAAVQHAVRTDDTPLVLRFARSMARWYLETGLRDDLDALLGAANRAIGRLGGHDDLLIELRGLEGESRRRENRPEEAVRLWLERAARAEARDEPDVAADAYTDVASLGLSTERNELVRAMLARIEALDLARVSAPVRATALVIGARLQLREGDEDGAADGAARAEALVDASGPDRQKLFVWMSLSQIFRATDRLPDSERAARRLVAEASAAGHLQSVGRGLLELARTLEGMGDPATAAEALHAAALVPKAASPPVWDEARAARAAFEARHGPDPLAQAAERGAGLDLRAQAERLGSSLAYRPLPLVEAGGGPD